MTLTSLPTLLVLSMVALLFGAGLGWRMQTNAWGLAALKGLMASFIGGLLCLHLLPEAYAQAGPMAILFMALGFLVMILPERLSLGHSPESGRFFTAEMLWIGLILHQAADGVGLALASSEILNNGPLAMAVIAHRIPVAAVVYWMFHRKGEVKGAWLRIGAMGIATVIGAMFSQFLEPFLSGNAINLFYAFVAGSFLHLLFHDFIDHHAHLERDRRAEFLAFIAGIVLLIAIESFSGHGAAHGHEHHMEAAHGALTHSFGESFVMLIRETAPYLLLGLVISGLLHVYLPMSPITWLKRGGPLKQSAKGMVFGLPLPICSCGVLPLFLSLSRKGVPPACAVAFLVATPELGVDSFLLSVKLLGVKFSVVRLIVAMLLPIAIAMVAVKFLPDKAISDEPVKSCCASKKDDGDEHDHDKGEPWWKFAFVSLVDDIFPFVFFGLFIAALAQTLWPQSEFGALVGHWDVVLLALIGIPFYVCASASVPFALVLLQHGFSVGAVVVFLFAGPATNVATILTVNKAFGKGMGLRLAATALAFAIIMGFIINAVYVPEDLGILEMHEHGWTWIEAVSLGVITLLGLVSLYRNGPLHWLSNVMSIIPGLTHHPKETAAH